MRISDWSSDVCSSDLPQTVGALATLDPIGGADRVDDGDGRVAGDGLGRERVAVGVELEHRAVQVVAVLVHATAHREDVVEGQTELVAPERLVGGEVVGLDADVDRDLDDLEPAANGSTTNPARRTIERSEAHTSELP